MAKNGMILTRTVYHKYLDRDVEFDNPFAQRVYDGLPGAIGKFRQHYDEEPSIQENLGAVDVTFFSNGEVVAESRNSVRGKDVFLIHQYLGREGEFSPNDGLMAHVAAVDGLKRAGAEKIHAIEPFFPYGRQERKDKPRRPITARRVSEILSKDINTFVTVDMHTGALEGYMDCPVVNLRTMPLFAHYYIEKGGLYRPVTPDYGGFESAANFAGILGCDEIGGIVKSTVGDNEKEAVYFIGDVEGCDCIIIDDMFDTAGTLTKAASKLKDNGARSVSGACTHGLNSRYRDKETGEVRRAADRVMESEVDELVVSDSIPLGDDFFKTYGERFREVSLGDVFANVIVRLHAPGSVSKYLGDYYGLFQDSAKSD